MLGFAVATAVALAIPATASAQGATFTARGSAEQVWVTGASPGEKLTLVDGHGHKVERKTAGPLGGIVFRKVDPGDRYRVRKGNGGPHSALIRVLTDKGKPPSTDIYNQQIGSGYGYLRTRDGTELAINTYLPGPADAGPYPTLIEYSGYGYADPSGGESSIEQILSLLGFAVVDVNMRGTGCSGGAFDFFEPLQGLDGYDVIETVARQPWVLNGKVGMAGVSYGGISQLFVGETRPPHLAAIAPLSVIDQTQTTLYPGGVLNTGFALQWAMDRVDDSQPAGPDTGQAWAYKRIQEGDEVCKANQELHPEAVNLLAKIQRNQYYKAKVADPLSPLTFVHKINVPVFMACQWTDEQTGGHCPTLAGAFTGTKHKWFTFTNGVHTDSLDPATFNRWYDFMTLYVAQRKPQLNPAQQAAAPIVYDAALGVHGVTLPDDPIQHEPDYASALAAFEALPQVRILFDNGAGSAVAGNPQPGFEQSFSKWPIPGTKGRSFFLDRDGALSSKAPKDGGKEKFSASPTARPPTDFSGNTGGGTNGLWTATPPYDWTQNPAGTAASYVSDPLSANTTVIGGGALTAWVRSAKKRVDLQATVSEVRPDGIETFVQSGWVRGDLAKLDRKKSTKLAPVLSLKKNGQEGPVAEQVDQGDDPALLPGPRLPDRVADPRDRERRGRRPAGLGVRGREAEAPGQGPDRPHGLDAVEAAPAGGQRRRRADRPAALPGPARRAVPDLPAVRELQLAARLS